MLSRQIFSLLAGPTARTGSRSGTCSCLLFMLVAFVPQARTVGRLVLVSIERELLVSLKKKTNVRHTFQKRTGKHASVDTSLILSRIQKCHSIGFSTPCESPSVKFDEQFTRLRKSYQHHRQQQPPAAKCHSKNGNNIAEIGFFSHHLGSCGHRSAYTQPGYGTPCVILDLMQLFLTIVPKRRNATTVLFSYFCSETECLREPRV